MTWHCRTLGDPDGDQVVLLHGFLGSSGDWEGVITAGLGAWRCLLVDLPGHGGTPLGSRPSFERWSDELADTLASLELVASPIIGYSLGGRLGVELALRHPERVTGLALCSTGLGLDDPGDRACRVALDERRAADLRARGLRRFLADWYRGPIFGGLANDARRLEALIDLRACNDAGAMAEVVSALSPGRRRPFDLEALGVPVAYLAGADDPKYSRVASALAELAPAVEVTVIDGAAHAVHLDAPADVARVVADLLSQTRTSAERPP